MGANFPSDDVLGVDKRKSESAPRSSHCYVAVYLDSGVVHEYGVSDPMKGREHAAAIIKSGYRHTAEGSDDLEWFPPHRIEKVKVTGGGESSKYRDRTRAT